MSDKFVTPADLPTEYERELLIILMEECNEISQRASKILRFGALEVQPGQPLDNVERMSRELGDLMCVWGLLFEQDLICPRQVALGKENKAKQLFKYMQTSKPVKETA
ncbi:hypothetical protein [Kiloniella majae]|uniref:hypothetical protein n=1 Tax=Kiloniella majae TaxID=1938558 RepID=UPI000A277DC0|nr:hypothetical protein [Kiloniella majae]